MILSREIACLDKSHLVNIFQNQIVTLNINGKEDVLLDHLEIHRPANIFMNILIMCQKLRHFKFYTSVPWGCGYISFGKQSPMFTSSTLVELHMTVYRFDECLFLLDGRFNQLRILFVTTFHVLPLERTMINKVNYLTRRIRYLLLLLIICFFQHQHYVRVRNDLEIKIRNFGKNQDTVNRL
jgi:hypothetical protein